MALTQKMAGAVGLIAAGVVSTLLGGVIWSVCLNSTPLGGIQQSCGPGPTVVIIFGVILLIAGVGLALASAYSGPRTIYPTTDPAVPPPLVQPVLVQQTIVQQTVEVRCRYCGSLNPVAATKCTTCGASL